MVSALMAWIEVKPMRCARKAATATSLAAFSTVQLPSGSAQRSPGQMQPWKAPGVGLLESQRAQRREIHVAAPDSMRCGNDSP